MSIDYSEKIPNNVDLAGDRRLQRALESWQPNFINWWKTMGPAVPTEDVYLRTAVAVGREGWAHFDHVVMEDYRWGVFLAERNSDRRIAFGEQKGEPVWQQVPGEYRADLQRLIVIQGDTEPASVEQQRRLGETAPSLYDLRNLFQVNVEEGRHLWAMVYLLHAYFGRAGREEAEALLQRNSGDLDSPRILGAFNEETPDWLSFFMFTYFTDRDGKYQLGTLKESAFDPLSRTCEFMLKEEAHHMFVGTTGVDRVVARTAELMREHDTEDVAPHGGIPLDVIQKYVNFHYSVSLDLFGSEKSTNAANYFTAGLKGRWQEERRKDDHVLTEDGPRRRDDPRRRDHHRAGLGAGRAQPRPAHRVRGRLPDRDEALEPRAGERRDRPQALAAPRRVQPARRAVRGPPRHARGRARRPGRVGGEPRPLAAERGRQDPRALAHAPGLRAREDGRLDRSPD
jgi:benzoyl-CoA 2,3-dioxygenase component B